MVSKSGISGCLSQIFDTRQNLELAHLWSRSRPTLNYNWLGILEFGLGIINFFHPEFQLPDSHTLFSQWGKFWNYGISCFAIHCLCENPPPNPSYLQGCFGVRLQASGLWCRVTQRPSPLTIPLDTHKHTHRENCGDVRRIWGFGCGEERAGETDR